MVKIRRATINDKSAIFEFLSIAYIKKAKYKYPERWEWQFENNPFREGDEIPVWIAENDEGNIVGQTCVMFEPLKVGTETYRLSWAADTIVLPEYRSKKIGFKLKKACLEDNNIYMSLTMAKATRHLYMKLDCKAINSVPVFNKLERFDSQSTITALKNRLNGIKIGDKLVWLLHFLWLDRMIPILLNVIVMISDIRLTRYINSDIEIKHIHEFDGAINEFWNSVSPQFYAIIQRKKLYLNWKYVQQPHMYYQIFTAERDGKICGYIILRMTRIPERNKGIIADLFVPIEDKDTIYSLLVFAVRYFKLKKVKYIEVASTIEEYKNAFSKLGFKFIKEVSPIFKSNIIPPPFDLEFMQDKWFFGRSDHEWDQFPYA